MFSHEKYIVIFRNIKYNKYICIKIKKDICQFAEYLYIRYIICSKQCAYYLIMIINII